MAYRRKYPSIVKMTSKWFENLNSNGIEYAPGKYCPARPLPMEGGFRRWRAAWMVFTGRADALIWPGGQ